jgi:hypothetical protein
MQYINAPDIILGINDMRVTMVETVCENNDERIDSDSNTIEIIAILADDPNYEYYLLKLTTGPTLPEQ